MPITKLSSKGQVLIPKAVRVALNWRAGMAFDLQAQGDHVTIQPLTVPSHLPSREEVRRVAGLIEYNGLYISDVETGQRLDAAAQRDWLK